MMLYTYLENDANEKWRIHYEKKQLIPKDSSRHADRVFQTCQGNAENMYKDDLEVTYVQSDKEGMETEGFHTFFYA